MTVQLIIKSAAQNVEDFKLNCEMNWTIAQVKDQITELYPTKPAKEHQKLIYGGKLLPDHLPLTSILNPMQDIHTIHLVCPFASKYESDSSNKSKVQNSTPACTVPPLSSGGIYPQQLPTPTVFTNPVQAFPVNTPSDAVHQYLALQQMYTQFLRQYLSQYNPAAPYGQVPVNTTPVQQPAPVAPQQNVNVNPEPRPQRWDAIDFLYIISRATMLFAVLIYYSSPPRILAVIVMILFLTVLAKMNRERQEEERRIAATARQSVENTSETATDSAGNAEEVNENDSQPVAEEVPQVQQALALPYIILTAIMSFFTSLIPEDPAAVNAN